MSSLNYIIISMKILFVLFSLPHLSQSAMYSDLVNVFNDNGHNVFPIAPINNEHSKSYLSNENGIDVLRVKTKDVFSKNLIEKGLANVLLSFQYKKALQKYWKHESFDLVIVATPSVMFADFITFVKEKTSAKVFLLQKDIFPQNAVDLGFMKKNSIIYRFFKKHEVKLLKAANYIGCTSPGNIKYLINHYSFLNNTSLNLVYNSSKLLNVSISHDVIKEKYKLKNKFVVVFGGNMGKPQQLENVLKLAKNASIFNDVIFLIIGKGTEVDNLKNEAFNYGLQNIMFIDRVPREDYFNLLSACNLGLISLHKNFTVPNTPMKLKDYLNAKLPVLASIDRTNDLGELLINHEMGRFAYADDSEQLFNVFKDIYNNEEERIKMGENGYKFCIENLSVQNSYQTIINILNNV